MMIETSRTTFAQHESARFLRQEGDMHSEDNGVVDESNLSSNTRSGSPLQPAPTPPAPSPLLLPPTSPTSRRTVVDPASAQARGVASTPGTRGAKQAAESCHMMPPRPTNSPKGHSSTGGGSSIDGSNGIDHAVVHRANSSSSTQQSSPKQQAQQHGRIPPRQAPTHHIGDREAPARTPSANSHGSNKLSRHQEAQVASPMHNGVISPGPVEPRSVKDTIEMEQAIFVQRLCEDFNGVAVRKINHYGKSNLRYVRCVALSDDRSSRSVSSRTSVGSWGRKHRQRFSPDPSQPPGPSSEKMRKALAWGRKKEILIPLNRFVVVRKGKTTERAKRNPSPANRVLSLLTDDPNHPSLDIEAPTRVDRDKFARAFARFLEIPLEVGDDAQTVHSAELQRKTMASSATSSYDDNRCSMSAPGDVTSLIEKQGTVTKSSSSMEKGASAVVGVTKASSRVVAHGNNHDDSSSLPVPSIAAASARDVKVPSDSLQSSLPSLGHHEEPINEVSQETDKVVSRVPSNSANHEDDGDNEGTEVSSLTGHGYDQELVEELHQALNELRSELEESRAEAARAVKVAEQAIQSAEKSNSSDWQNTVTHKAAEAAAIAQRRSAEAIARQRLAEERLEGERRTAAFWRKQAEIAEEEAGKLQTRAAAAEVQRASIEEQLESERSMATSQFDSLKNRFVSMEKHHRGALDEALERTRTLEVELSATRQDLRSKVNENLDLENFTAPSTLVNGRKKLSFGRRNKAAGEEAMESAVLLSDTPVSSTHLETPATRRVGDGVLSERVLELQSESTRMRQQFELLRKATADELKQLPLDSLIWTKQISELLVASQTETARLRKRLSGESACRRKLLHEVQDLRGAVRVYCRPTLAKDSGRAVSIPSQEILMLHTERDEHDLGSSAGQMCFEFDRIFQPDSSQQDVYCEIDEICMGVLDGFNICIMGYGQRLSGKTETLFGEFDYGSESVNISNYGVHFKTMQQLFSVAEHRSDRYKDTFTMTIVEVHDERICDLFVGTKTGESRGQAIVADVKSSRRSKASKGTDDDSSGKQSRLEIRSDVNGNTVIHGVLSVEVKDFEDLLSIWKECLAVRAKRLAEQEIILNDYTSTSHVIATIKNVSSNIATGLGSVGKIEFVDIADADLVRRRESTSAAGTSTMTTPAAAASQEVGTTGIFGGESKEYRFANRSVETLAEVVDARSRYTRSVPYRNSTVTHLLRDSLESDTKVVLIACVSSDTKDIRETASTLRFASRMRKVTVGTATRHTIAPP